MALSQQIGPQMDEDEISIESRITRYGIRTRFQQMLTAPQVPVIAQTTKTTVTQQQTSITTKTQALKSTTATVNNPIASSSSTTVQTTRSNKLSDKESKELAELQDFMSAQFDYEFIHELLFGALHSTAIVGHQIAEQFMLTSSHRTTHSKQIE
jgi:hypothetical protein